MTQDYPTPIAPPPELVQPGPQSESCPGCEGTPAANNSPCAVCGQTAQPQPQGPTDEELQRRFLVWWHDEGSDMLPLCGRDYEEHARRISEIAWANGAYVARWGHPKPPSLKEQALAILTGAAVYELHGGATTDNRLSAEDMNTIRRALEQLDD